LPPENPRAATDQTWTWSQHWLDVLFLHWSVPVSAVLPHVPASLEVETHGGLAWVSLVLFRLKVRPRWLPFLPGVSSLTEVNFRTYVRCGGRPGICFLSMHADNAWAIRLARLLTPLPYRRAGLRYRRSAETFSFDGHDPSSPDCQLSLTFKPTGRDRKPPSDSLDAWLLERYRLFLEDMCQTLWEACVIHPAWLVRDVEMLTPANRAGPWWRHAPARPPDLTHFSVGVTAHFGPFRPFHRRAPTSCLTKSG
jgi:uncharacterized protein YqjF (DUF2071 family)